MGLKKTFPLISTPYHWLRVPHGIELKLAVVMYRCLHLMAPQYLADELHRVADILYSRRRLSLRSSSTSTLVVPPMRHSTIGDHSFPVAASG